MLRSRCSPVSSSALAYSPISQRFTAGRTGFSTGGHRNGRFTRCRVMNDPSRKYRWILLGTSLLTIGYLVAAAVRENFLAEWYRIQMQYQTNLESKATDHNGRAIAHDFRIELKQ